MYNWNPQETKKKRAENYINLVESINLLFEKFIELQEEIKNNPSVQHSQTTKNQSKHNLESSQRKTI